MQLTPDKKLVLRLPGWLGDAVACEPVLRALAEFYTAAGVPQNLTVAAPMRLIMFFSPAFPGVGWMAIDRAPADRPAGWRGHDVALLLTGSFRSAWMVWRARVPVRVGWGRDGRGLLLTIAPRAARERGAVPLGLGRAGRWPRRLPRPVGESSIELLHALGVPVRDTHPRLAPTEEGRAALAARLVRLRLGADTPFVLANVGARAGSAKAVSPHVFAAAIAELHERTGLATLISCGPGEREMLHAVQEADPGKGTYPCADPVVDLPELVALCARAKLVITADHGPRHVALAAGAPVVTICGPTDARHTAAHLERQRVVSVEVPCGPCHKEVCPLEGAQHHVCMTSIPPARIVAAAEELLNLSAAHVAS